LISVCREGKKRRDLRNVAEEGGGQKPARKKLFAKKKGGEEKKRLDGKGSIPAHRWGNQDSEGVSPLSFNVWKKKKEKRRKG